MAKMFRFLAANSFFIFPTFAISDFAIIEKITSTQPINYHNIKRLSNISTSTIWKFQCKNRKNSYVDFCAKTVPILYNFADVRIFPWRWEKTENCYIWKIFVFVSILQIINKTPYSFFIVCTLIQRS